MLLSVAPVRIILPQILRRSARIVHQKTIKCCSHTPGKHRRRLCTSITPESMLEKLELPEEKTESIEELAEEKTEMPEELVASSPHKSAYLNLIELIREEVATNNSDHDMEPPSTFHVSDLRNLSIDEAKKSILQNFNPINAVEMFTQLEKSGNNSVPRILDSLTVDLINDEQFGEALNLVKEIVKKEVFRINMRTYTRLLKGFVERRRVTGDTDIEDKFAIFIYLMDENKYVMDCWQHYQVLHMASLVGNGHVALSFFNQLKADRNYKIDGSHYELLLKALINEARNKNEYNNHPTVLNYFSELVESGLEFHNYVIKALIDNSVLSSMVDETREVIMKLTKDADVYLEYIDLLVRIEPLLGSGLDSGLSRARTIYSGSRHNWYCEGFKDLYISTVTQYKDNIVTDFNCVRALEIVSELKNAGDSRVNNIVHHIIVYLVENNQLDDAVEFSKLLTESNIPISPQTYTKLLWEMVDMKKENMDSHIEKQFFSLIQFMNEHGHRPNGRQQAQVFRMAYMTGNEQMAQVCFDEMKADVDNQLNSSDYGLMLRVLINAARSQKDYSNQETVLRHFNEMVGEGIELKAVHIKAFIENSVLSSTVDAAREEIAKLSKHTAYYMEYLDMLVDVELLLRSHDVTGARKVWKGTKYATDCEQFMTLYFT